MGFTYRYLRPSDPYYPKWRAMRRRSRILFWGTVGLGFLAVFVSGLLSNLFRDVPREVFFVTASGASVIVAVALSFWSLSWPCPRCGKPFYGSVSLRRFRDNCPHCGLREYARSPEDD